MKHYTFIIHLKGNGQIQGGSLGNTFEEAKDYFLKQEEAQKFVKEYGPIDRWELISEEAPEDATPEAARSKGLESLALATQTRIAGDHRVRIGQELMEARVDCGLSIERVAEITSIKAVTIRNIEAGKFAANIDLLSKIAECYNCEIGVCDKYL